MNHKIFLSILILLSSTGIKAQNDRPASLDKAYSFGLYAGVNFQNINGSDPDGGKLKNTLVLRYVIGINEEIKIAPEFYFQPGLQFISKGTKGTVNYTDNTSTRALTRTIKMNYIEMPLNIVFKPLLGTGKMILGFGPYIGYSFGGKATFTGNASPAESDIKYMNTAPDNDFNHLIYFKPWDLGANFFVGYQFAKGFNFVLNTQLGMIKINANDNTKLANKNTGFGITLGYRF